AVNLSRKLATLTFLISLPKDLAPTAVNMANLKATISLTKMQTGYLGFKVACFTACLLLLMLSA
ncbi:MAG: hypothetical protein QNL48_05730, partial [Alcaligenes aquatilis]